MPDFAINTRGSWAFLPDTNKLGIQVTHEIDMKKYSGKQVIKAGEDLANSGAIHDDQNSFSKSMDVLSYWRGTHIKPLEEAFNLLQVVSLKKDKNAIFAKRLKRYISIIIKLLRFESMKLKNMQDIGGCRAVLTSEKKLRKIVRELKKQPQFKGNGIKNRYKDYISQPKNDGYRSYHLIGKFPDQNGDLKNIEIQLRTRIQHYWATALEIVDLFTDQALKSNQGDEIWKLFFFNASLQFSVIDSIHMHETLPCFKKEQSYKLLINKNNDLLSSREKTIQTCNALEVFKKLQAFSASLKTIDDTIDQEEIVDSGYVLLVINTTNSTLTSNIFKKDESLLAEESYIKAEKEAVNEKGVIVALVSTAAVGGIKEAYPNYFADSTMFLEYLNIVTETHKKAPE